MGSTRPTRIDRWGRVLTTTLLAVFVSACGAPTTSVGASAGPSAVPPRAGRSVCPGSVPRVGTDLTGAPSDELERLQGIYEDDPGFLAVVWDGQRGVIVVDARQLVVWQARMGPLGIAVARSCVDPALLAALDTVLPRISRQQNRKVSVGYDALADRISVLGVDADALMAAMEEAQPGAGAAALAAIAAGTLSIGPAISGGR